MRDCIKALKKSNINFYTDLIIELGLLRKRNECAICFKLINIKDYSIQLCRDCRKIHLDRFANAELKDSIKLRIGGKGVQPKINMILNDLEIANHEI